MVADSTPETHAMSYRALLILSIAAAGWADAADAGDQERVRRAISYLDARQDDWARFAGAQRGEGADRTTCVSCHTGVGYALARPELGRFTGTNGRVELGQRTVAAVSLRVEHWAELDSLRYRLMYDSDDRKKVESRGTEAVLDTLILARDDAAQGRATPAPTTRVALQHLWEAQATAGEFAGSWDWLDFNLAPWEADGSRVFGATLAAIAVGSAPGYQDNLRDEAASRGIRSLRDYLQRRFPEESLYHRIWILEASFSLDGLLTPDQRKSVVDQLLAARRKNGGWALATLGDFGRVDGTPQPQDSDGYATGLVVHVLLRAGLPSVQTEVAQGLSWLRSNQREDGSWPGRSVNKERDPTTFLGKLMSDAATAVAAQALVEADSR